jgi:hypothetical protein
MTPNPQSEMVANINQAMAAAHGHPEAELVSLHDPLDGPLPDLADEPGAEQGYLDWLRQREHHEEWNGKVMGQ